MYVLIVPASVPFVLLATVMGLSWWEDHILPLPAEPVDHPAKAPFAPAAPARLAELPRVDTALTREVAGR
ncbi:hypothetical protein [Streptomyces sp. IB201691-2A2]|uniref:hypothetical protein n=1 Tax=Streptomyces sp. IB201691-2A2 TaxID=2561920 RepID=UPI00117D7483|nr:hypothetical protein [Streptomyces sp. IB201691-2A2]TRO55624.1 hypothetical protein E4K73_49930 [Streptomyces sp. IB201691-2A2]